MEEASFTFSFFVIFTGAAVLASVALYTRQPLIIAYIFLGALVGPFGFGLIDDLHLLTSISQIGILFLLFLLGLDMQPQALLAVARQATIVCLVSAALFAAIGFAVARLFGFPTGEAAVIGAAMMFSSTIIGIKLLPTTVLHHKHIGELMVGILLLQDLLAILVLMALLHGEQGPVSKLATTALALPVLLAGVFLMVRYALLPLIAKFDRFQEYIFLLALGWCLGVSEVAKLAGLSAEIGAFIAGISIATSPISQFIAASLRPLRDFFLILFFFSLGAGFDFSVLRDIWQPMLVLAVAMLAIKPVVFRFLLGRVSEHGTLAWDVGFRLGQNSEFSLLIAFLAFDTQVIDKHTSLLIQATAIITFLVSSYIVIFNYPNPIAVSDRLRRD